MTSSTRISRTFYVESDREAVATGKSHTGEGWLTFAVDGYRGYFEAIKTPMRDRTGKPIGVVGIARDITERSKAEEQLRIAAAAFEAQEGIAILGADGRILRVNRAFTEITGYTNEDVVGKTPNQLRSDKHDDAFYQSDLGSHRPRGKLARRGLEPAQMRRALSSMVQHRGGQARQRRDHALRRARWSISPSARRRKSRSSTSPITIP